MGWAAFESELKYLYFLKKNLISSCHGSFVINNNVKIEKWKKRVVCPLIMGVKFS